MKNKTFKIIAIFFITIITMSFTKSNTYKTTTYYYFASGWNHGKQFIGQDVTPLKTVRFNSKTHFITDDAVSVQYHEYVKTYTKSAFYTEAFIFDADIFSYAKATSYYRKYLSRIRKYYIDRKFRYIPKRLSRY